MHCILNSVLPFIFVNKFKYFNLYFRLFPQIFHHRTVDKFSNHKCIKKSIEFWLKNIQPCRFDTHKPITCAMQLHFSLFLISTMRLSWVYKNKSKVYCCVSIFIYYNGVIAWNSWSVLKLLKSHFSFHCTWLVDVSYLICLLLVQRSVAFKHNNIITIMIV